MYDHLLQLTDHRPFPYPNSAWVSRQHWGELLFANYPIDVATLQAKLPKGMIVDTFDGMGWLSIVPFYLKMSFRGLPKSLWPIRFPELNVRTYVRVNGHPAIYFFSLDCTDFVSVMAARTWFNLTYRTAKMQWHQGDSQIRISSTLSCPAKEGSFSASYSRDGDPIEVRPDSFENFIVSRWNFFSPHPFKPNTFIRGDIHHEAWTLQQTEFTVNHTTLLSGHGFSDDLPLHSTFYAKEAHVLAFNRSLVTLNDD